MTRMTIRHTSSGMQETESAPRHGRGAIWTWNAIVLAITGTIMYQLFPQFTQNVVFDGILRNGLYLIPPIILVLWARTYARRHGGVTEVVDRIGDHRRTISYAAFLGVVYVLWCMLVYASTDWMTYRAYSTNATERTNMIPAAPEFVRFTPLQNACTDLSNSLSATGQHVECSHVFPIVTDKGFGYAAPITPAGVYNTFTMKNPGFLLMDDSADAYETPTRRRIRIDDAQQVGLGMEWFDNLEYVLAKTDFFANYDTPHLLALDPKQPKKLTTVVPKIKYGWFFRLPYWGGVVLVHANGKVEDLSAEQARADARLRGKWIYPLSLAKKYIEIQNYGVGWGLLTPFMTLEGLLKVEPLPGHNQFPFLTQGVDGRTYLVTATMGKGSARGLYRMYFVDAATGAITYHQYRNDEVVYGAGASLERITNIPGYQWKVGSGEKASGSMIAIEPVYIVRPNDPTLYWKFTITNVNYSGISATAVANSAKPDDILVFTHRKDFEAWLHGKEVATVQPQPTGSSREELLQLIQDLATRLDAIRRKAESLPK